MAKQCKQCGAWAEDMDRFCQQCGSSLIDAIVEDTPEAVDAEIILPTKRYHNPAADAREVRERLIGEKTEYYLPRFDKMETLNSFTDWNWCAFLFGITWMLYRKMYAIAVAMYVLTQVLNLAGASLLSAVVWVGTGLVGNFLYMKDINRRTEKAMNMQPEEREVYIEKNSGTGWIGIIVMLIVSSLLGGMLL
jgi:hypothetical protein